MITEDYVSYETAKLLKTKGFSEYTICRYADVGGITERWYDDYRERVLQFHWNEGYLIEPSVNPKDQYEIIGNTISAPTLQMVMKYLREVHKIVIVIDVYSADHWEGYIDCFEINIYSHASTMIVPNEIAHHTDYTEAVEAALKYALENLI